MRKAFLAILTGLLVFSSLNALAADDVKTQKIKASYMLAFGRPAEPGEVKHWNSQPNYSMKELMDRHRAYISSGYQDFVITRAYIDAMGRLPLEDEKKYWRPFNQNYSELMKNHVNWLGGGNKEYDKVIKRAFHFVAGRLPDADELRIWKGKGVKSYLILVGLLQHSKAEAAKTGVKRLMGLEDWISSFSTALAAVFVSKPVAAEILALVGNDGASMVAAGGGNMVAAGGGNVMIKAELIGNDGGSMVAAGGGNIVGNAGGNIE